ncbi:MAG: hypothetical protein K2V38_18890 [Gemmataceae bacterium]|nr:hypothetical protein [Gemmataceae bacterium]
MSKKNGPEPFFRPKKNRWYVEIDGKHVNLGPDEPQVVLRCPRSPAVARSSTGATI